MHTKMSQFVTVIIFWKLLQNNCIIEQLGRFLRQFDFVILIEHVSYLVGKKGKVIHFPLNSGQMQYASNTHWLLHKLSWGSSRNLAVLHVQISRRLIAIIVECARGPIKTKKSHRLRKNRRNTRKIRRGNFHWILHFRIGKYRARTCSIHSNALYECRFLIISILRNAMQSRRSTRAANFR